MTVTMQFSVTYALSFRLTHVSDLAHCFGCNCRIPKNSIVIRDGFGYFTTAFANSLHRFHGNIKPYFVDHSIAKTCSVCGCEA